MHGQDEAGAARPDHPGRRHAEEGRIRHAQRTESRSPTAADPGDHAYREGPELRHRAGTASGRRILPAEAVPPPGDPSSRPPRAGGRGAGVESAGSPLQPTASPPLSHNPNSARIAFPVDSNPLVDAAAAAPYTETRESHR